MEVGLGEEAILPGRPQPQPKLGLAAVRCGLHAQPGKRTVGRSLVTSASNGRFDAALLVCWQILPDDRMKQNGRLASRWIGQARLDPVGGIGRLDPHPGASRKIEGGLDPVPAFGWSGQT